MGFARGGKGEGGGVWRARKQGFFSHKRLAYKYTVYIIESTADH
jgi:hypothetical protein